MKDKQKISSITEISELVEAKRETFIQASDQIWGYGETRFEEKKSAALLCEILEKEGFKIQLGLAGMATAFLATYGTEGSVIGFLGEYDALSGLSQEAGIPEKRSLSDLSAGHGCGHNLLGVGSLAAAVALKDYLVMSGEQGCIRYYGCPAEEGGSGKAFMAREGLFDDLDIALSWHPMNYHTVWSMPTLANFQVAFRFYGKSAHAASVPHLGRSALDAVELMNVGVNYLREHVVPEARMHYAITNSGGTAPNVVQAEAEVLYLLRAPKLGQVREIYERVCDVARGAALMTGTRCEIRFEKGCSNVVPNQTVEEKLYENFQAFGIPKYTREERELAKKFKETLTEVELKNDVSMSNQFMGGSKITAAQLIDQDIPDILFPYTFRSALLPGSTDVGDVSWIVPTGQVIVGTNVFGTPGHSWQFTGQGKTSYAHKGMLLAGKIMAQTGLDFLQNPEWIKKAKEELVQNLEGEKYESPIPNEVKPAIPEQKQ